MSLISRLIPFLLCLVGTFVYHRHSILSGLDLVQADTNDSRFITSILEHWFAVARGIANWNSPLMFYPEKGTLGYSDFLLGYAILYVPARFIGLQPHVALNVVVIISSLLTFTFTYFLTRRAVALQPWIAGVVAYLFTFSWPRFAQSAHIQLQCSFFIPLVIILLFFAADAHSRNRSMKVYLYCLSLAVVTSLFLSTSYYLAFFLALGLAAVLLCAVIVPATRRALLIFISKRYLPLLCASILNLILLIPMLSVYLPVQRQTGGRVFAEVLPYIPYLRDLIWMGTENFAWGAISERYPSIAAVNWAELRIGFGLVWSVTWCVCALCALLVAFNKRFRNKLSGIVSLYTSIDSKRLLWLLLGVVVVVSMQVIALRYPHILSPWRVFFKFLPGASAARSVARYVLVSSLLMSMVIGVFIQIVWRWSETLKRNRRPVRATLIVLIAITAAEQMGKTVYYSGEAALSQAQFIAAQVPSHCKAFFILPKTQKFERTNISRENFEEARYLAANPDVAAIWPGSAWDHFVQYGAKEMRFIDPVIASDHRKHVETYAYSIPIVAAMIGKPSVNGISGLVPKGWELMDVYHPLLSERLRSWLGEQIDEVCMIALDIDPAAIPLNVS